MSLPAPRLLRRVRRRLLGSTETSAASRPAPDARLSVVVPISDAQAPFLDECLDSLLPQYDDLQVLLLPHGPSDESASVARRRAELDARIVLSPLSDSASDARDLGARLAGGAYLAFVGGADLVPPGSFRALVSSLQKSGSDFAVGALRRNGRSPRQDNAVEQVHRVARRGVTLSQLPDAVADAFLPNKVFRRSFWEGAGLHADEPSRSGTAVCAVRAYLLARTFDVLARVTYRWMERGQGETLGALPVVMPQLGEWVEALRGVLAGLAGAPEDVRTAWLLTVLDRELVPFLDDAERADEDQWLLLGETCRRLLEAAGEVVVARVRAEARVKAWLAAEGRRDELESFVADRWAEEGDLPTEVVDGVGFACLPFYRDPLAGPPADWYRLSETETSLSASLRGMCWQGAGRVELKVFAFVNHIDMAGEPPHVTAALVDPDGGEQVVLEVAQRSDPAVTLAAGHLFQSYDQGVVLVTVDGDALLRVAPGGPPSPPAPGPKVRSWSLRLTLTCQGVTRSATVTSRDVRSSAGYLERRTRDGRLWGPVWRPDGLRIEASAPLAVLDSVRLSGRTLSCTARRGGGEPAGTLRLVDEKGTVVTTAERVEGDEPTTSLTLPAPEGQPTGATSRRWALQSVAADGSSEPVAWPEDVEDRWVVPTHEGSSLVLARTQSGTTQVIEAGRTAYVDAVHLREGGLELTGGWVGEPPEDWSLELSGERCAVPGVVSSESGGGFRAVLDLAWDPWGLGARPIPVGTYQLRLQAPDEGGGASERRLEVGPGLVRRTPEILLSSWHRVAVRRAADNRPVLVLNPPLREEEMSSHRQHRLRREMAGPEHAVDPSAVYLQSYHGLSATDSPLAIHRELRRTRPDLRLYWGVADASAWVPEGAIPVVLRSREWHLALATAKYLVMNIEFPPWFRKKPEQRVLQTFHGYPAKSMGLRLWQGKHYTQRRIEKELARISGEWDLILTPIPEMDEYYRREYRYQGPILSHGYPRDDDLVSGDADRVRADARRRLGIADDQTAVLYAPTWRDDLATRPRSVPLARHLDLESASDALGDEFVVLMRGHRFHAAGRSTRTGGVRHIEVTDYPEVNDLILAADVGVMDYSSLRFDFALTRKPMLFLVPDLTSYSGAVRGFLYDYASTAPGPLLDTAEEVVACLTDLPAIERAHEAAYERFLRRFQYLQDGRSAESVAAAFFGAA